MYCKIYSFRPTKIVALQAWGGTSKKWKRPPCPQLARWPRASRPPFCLPQLSFGTSMPTPCISRRIVPPLLRLVLGRDGPGRTCVGRCRHGSRHCHQHEDAPDSPPPPAPTATVRATRVRARYAANRVASTTKRRRGATSAAGVLAGPHLLPRSGRAGPPRLSGHEHGVLPPLRTGRTRPLEPMWSRQPCRREREKQWRKRVVIRWWRGPWWGSVPDDYLCGTNFESPGDFLCETEGVFMTWYHS